MKSNAKLKLVTNERPGPSLSYLMLRRNPALASPTRFEPTRKSPQDVVI